jgi:hypothetical protein
MQVKLGGIKRAIRRYKWKKARQYNDKNKDKTQPMIYIALHRKLKFEENDPH